MGIYPAPFLLGISLPLHLVYIALFGVAFPYSGSLSSSLYCGVSSVGGVGQVACQGFLVREACVGILVGGAGFFSLECNEVSSNEL